MCSAVAAENSGNQSLTVLLFQMPANLLCGLKRLCTVDMAGAHHSQPTLMFSRRHQSQIMPSGDRTKTGASLLGGRRARQLDMHAMQPDRISRIVCVFMHSPGAGP